MARIDLLPDTALINFLPDFELVILFPVASE